MESPPADDGFELVSWGTDDEYDIVEAPARAQPVEGGNQAFPPPGRETVVGCDQGSHTKTIVPPTSKSPQGAVAASWSPPPPQKAPAKIEEKMKMASPLRSCGVAAATDEPPPPHILYDLFPPTRSPSPPQKAPAKDEEKVKVASPLRSYDVAAAMDEAQRRLVLQDLIASARSPPQILPDLVAATRSPSPPQKAHAKEEKMKMEFPLRRYDDVAPRGLPLHGPVYTRGRVSDLKAAPTPARGFAAVAAPPLQPSAAYGEADEDDEDEVSDDDDYCSYRSCYDLADFGRSKHVKRSSGRRGRTKKATTMGRPRGEARSWRNAGNL